MSAPMIKLTKQTGRFDELWIDATKIESIHQQQYGASVLTDHGREHVVNETPAAIIKLMEAAARGWTS